MRVWNLSIAILKCACSVRENAIRVHLNEYVLSNEIAYFFRVWELQLIAHQFQHCHVFLFNLINRFSSVIHFCFYFFLCRGSNARLNQWQSSVYFNMDINVSPRFFEFPLWNDKMVIIWAVIQVCTIIIYDYRTTSRWEWRSPWVRCRQPGRYLLSKSI